MRILRFELVIYFLFLMTGRFELFFLDKKKTKKVFFCSQNDWWLAKHCNSGLKGYIPALYVAPHGGLDVNE